MLRDFSLSFQVFLQKLFESSFVQSVLPLWSSSSVPTFLCRVGFKLGDTFCSKLSICFVLTHLLQAIIEIPLHVQSFRDQGFGFALTQYACADSGPTSSFNLLFLPSNPLVIFYAFKFLGLNCWSSISWCIQGDYQRASELLVCSMKEFILSCILVVAICMATI